jgi:hypothetical protein
MVDLVVETVDLVKRYGSARACVFPKWLKMVFTALLGFGGSFEVQIYF